MEHCFATELDEMQAPVQILAFALLDPGLPGATVPFHPIARKVKNPFAAVAIVHFREVDTAVIWLAWSHRANSNIACYVWACLVRY